MRSIRTSSTRGSGRPSCTSTITGLSFYNFPYTFGYLLSLGLFSRARADASFLPRYEAFLAATGTASAPDVVRECLGEDTATTAFWNASLDLVESDLGRFERETAAGAPGGGSER